MLYTPKTLSEKEYKLMEDVLMEGASTKIGLIKDGEAPELIREAIEDVDNCVTNNFDFYYDVLNRARELAYERRNPEAGNISGYYKINAETTHEGLDGYVTFHRGKGLPALREDKNIYNLLFPESTRKEIEETEEYVYATSIFNDVFTQDEVAGVIKDTYPEVMNITITPVLTNSIDNYFSVAHIPYDKRHALVMPSGRDKYFLTIDWHDKTIS